MGIGERRERRVIAVCFIRAAGRMKMPFTKMGKTKGKADLGKENQSLVPRGNSYIHSKTEAIEFEKLRKLILSFT